MARTILHFLLWNCAVPWAACVVWFAEEAAARSWNGDWAQAAGTFLVSLPGSMFVAFFGVCLCLLITVPTSFIAFVMLRLKPTLTETFGFRIGFTISTCIIGLAWTAFMAAAMKTARPQYGLMVVGLLAGLTMGLLTLRLWKTRTNEPQAVVQA